MASSDVECRYYKQKKISYELQRRNRTNSSGGIEQIWESTYRLPEAEQIFEPIYKNIQTTYQLNTLGHKYNSRGTEIRIRIRNNPK